MDEDEEYAEEEGSWLVPTRWSPLVLVRVVTILAAGVTTSLQLAFDYLDDSIAAHQAYSDDQRDMQDTVRLEIEQLP